MEGSKTKARVICNPSSGGGAYDPDELREELGGFELDWVRTEGPEDAIQAAGEWREGLLLVAGGDGTVNDVVNGLGNAGFPEGVTLGILPTGTGNDLAATLCIPEDADLAEDVIRQDRVRTLDVARVRSEGIGERFFINVATGGLGAEISRANEGELKERWGKLSTSTARSGRCGRSTWSWATAATPAAAGWPRRRRTPKTVCSTSSS